MPIKINTALTPEKLCRKLIRVFELSGQKILALERRWDPADGAPVFTARGRYRSRGWTEWTQGFQFGSMLLQFDATGEREFLTLAQGHIARRMTAHLTHTGVHDHGFNIVSTYGNLLRLAREGRFDASAAELNGYQLALKVSGAVQAMRWTPVADGGGFIYSFNGPHSLFIDTMRTLRSLALAHLLGHHLLAERDREISLLQRLAQHASTTAHYSIFYGRGRDRYDRPGRTAHESLFNINDGSFRCPATQQGYSPFSTWTRGLAWAICGFAEQLQFFSALGRADLPRAAAETLIADCSRAAQATADYYLELSCTDGIPVWDSGAPNLAHLPDFAERTSDPYNRCEPVDSSAAAIAAQGLWRLGSWLRRAGKPAAGRRYAAAALTIAATLFDDPYLSCGPKHEGLILHSVYHRPNGWDYIAPRQAVPNGEGSMWGDYHARELALLLLRESTSHPGPPLNFFACALQRRAGNQT